MTLESSETQEGPVFQPTHETRFAVVMYGGVSLAVYINGVAQELMHLVRATAPREVDDAESPDESEQHVRRARHYKQLTGTQIVYRKLAYLLAQQKGIEPQEREAGMMHDYVNDKPIRMRFVVDILSGTSAGGINSVFLAKALANNQDIGLLKDLWINEGDISVLINDKDSVKNLRLSQQKPPKSVLNSQRMYLKLLDALHKMEVEDQSGANGKSRRSPLVEELDLFVTATDIQGLVVPIQLSDRVVYERRHRNVFHFRYAAQQMSAEDYKKSEGENQEPSNTVSNQEETQDSADSEQSAAGNKVARNKEMENDFTKQHNPFLAFVARCTSAFPFAFEPMRLCDIDSVIKHYPDYPVQEFGAASEQWKKFYKDYEQSSELGPSIEFAQRAFGDGGYLDNKPFSYATETLQMRNATLPVDRKLIYIEPAPTHPEEDPARTQPPDAIENTLAAVVTLPRYESIREDLQVILRRNRVIQRMNEIIEDIQKDVTDSKVFGRKRKKGKRVKVTKELLDKNEPLPENPDIPAELWEELGLDDMLGLRGQYYIPYRRLRIEAVTDDLTKLIGRFFNFQGDSDFLLAIHSLVHCWRDENFTFNRLKRSSGHNEEHEHQDKRRTINSLLYWFDITYRARRLSFLCEIIDRLLRGDAAELKRLREHVKAKGEGSIPDSKTPIEKALQAFKGTLSRINQELQHRYLQLFDNKQIQAVIDGNGSDSIDMSVIRQLLDGGYVSRSATRHEEDEETYDDGLGQLKAETTAASDDDICARAHLFLDENTEAKEYLQRIGTVVEEEIKKEVMDPHIADCDELFPSQGEPVLPENLPELRNLDSQTKQFFLTLQSYLIWYYVRFDDFDQIMFPMLYDSSVGESDVVDVIRISPEDATSLIDENRERRNQTNRKKLAGTPLYAFGAFFEKVWRENDILWGRLDGAERLIAAMLPDARDEKLRGELTREAHVAILSEEFLEDSRDELKSVLSQALSAAETGQTVQEFVDSLITDWNAPEGKKEKISQLMRCLLDNERFLGFMERDYEVDRAFQPKPLLQAISRSTRVVGEMLEDISEQRSFQQGWSRWLVRFGQILWGLVEVATPNSLWNAFFIHWLKLLYLLGAIVIVVSPFIGKPEHQSMGVALLVIVAIVHLTVTLLKDFLNQRKVLWKVVMCLVAATTVYVGYGIDHMHGLGLKEKITSALVSNWDWDLQTTIYAGLCAIAVGVGGFVLGRLLRRY